MEVNGKAGRGHEADTKPVTVEPPEIVDLATGRATVLVVGTDEWAIDQSVGALRAAGHRVLTCHDPGEPAFPCNALIQGRTCPLDVGFEVVLTARATPRRTPSGAEMGAICALHAGAALVSVGVLGHNPFEPWVTRSVGQDGDAAEACQEAAQARVPDLTVEAQR